MAQAAAPLLGEGRSSCLGLPVSRPFARLVTRPCSPEQKPNPDQPCHPAKGWPRECSAQHPPTSVPQPSSTLDEGSIPPVFPSPVCSPTLSLGWDRFLIPLLGPGAGVWGIGFLPHHPGFALSVPCLRITMILSFG